MDGPKMSDTWRTQNASPQWGLGTNAPAESGKASSLGSDGVDAHKLKTFNTASVLQLIVDTMFRVLD